LSAAEEGHLDVVAQLLDRGSNLEAAENVIRMILNDNKGVTTTCYLVLHVSFTLHLMVMAHNYRMLPY